MPKNRIIIILGVCVALLPILGFPKVWESFFQVLAGLAIIAVTVWASIDRKLSLKAKAQQRATRKSTEPPTTPDVVLPAVEDFGKRVTDFYPKTAPPGRRVTDVTPPSSRPEQN